VSVSDLRSRRGVLPAGVAASLVVLVAACAGGDETAPAPFPPKSVELTAAVQAPEGPPTQSTAPGDVPTVPLENAPTPLFALEAVLSGLPSPVYAATPESDSTRLYVVERAGRIVPYEDGEAREPLLDISELVRTDVEEGLHSVAFHPEYAENGRFFVAYNDRRGDVRVVEYHSDGEVADATAARELLAIDKTDGVKWHNGGQLQFGPDGLLYVSMGDSARNPYDELPGPPGTPDPNNNAQNLRLPYGKLLRLDVDEEAPEPHVVALGLRNPWRFSFDRENGDLYLADVGQFAWEELDYLPAGTSELTNFGWSRYEATAGHNESFELSRGRLVWPILRYEHEAGLYCQGRGSITGGYVYRGSEIPELDGRYVFGDYCSGEIWTSAVEGGRATDIRKEPVTVRELVSFAEDADGELYAISLAGEIRRLVRVE
jgi:glucose/arabinose dehydrogenase